MTQSFGPDNWSAGVAQLAHHLVPAVSATAVYERLGIGALYVMSEEWWDPSIIELHPRMPVGPIPALHDLRHQQLQRLTVLGVEMRSHWYRTDDQQLFHTIHDAIMAEHAVGLFGIVGASPVFVQAMTGPIVTGRDSAGRVMTIDLQKVRAPAGVECVIAMLAPTTLGLPDAELRWLVHLLGGLPTIAFDTPRHPLRDWQVWHVGADAFAVAALSAETAAPLAIVSDNVARIIYAYMWRIDVLQRQLEWIDQSYNTPALRDAIDACHDARFFMNVVAQHYPRTVERRALTIPEGALIAEACRDTRQALRNIANLLSSVY